jgi:hypothetical protein
MTLRRRLLLVGLLLPLLLAARLQTDDSNQAALVVRIDDQRVEKRCVTFTEDTITGHELLERSGLDYVVNASSAGVFVCNVEGQGCPANDCLCQCQGEPCIYWSYWRLSGAEWQYAGLGAAVTEIQDGDVEGWSWGPGSVTSAVAPPAVTFDEVCAAPASEPVVAPAETAASASDSPATSWLAYAAFLLVALLLVAAYLWLRRRNIS